MRELWTREEAAKFLGVHVRTVDSYIKRGLLVAFQPKGTNLTRIHINELKAFLANDPKDPTAGQILSTSP
jgi:excisionase family DNA binding protein